MKNVDKKFDKLIETLKELKQDIENELWRSEKYHIDLQQIFEDFLYSDDIGYFKPIKLGKEKFIIDEICVNNNITPHYIPQSLSFGLSIITVVLYKISNNKKYYGTIVKGNYAGYNIILKAKELCV